VHFISITGYNYSLTSGSYHKLILREQKKTATEAMAQICQGDFSQSLKIIANQYETVAKIKEHFTSLVQLMEIKAGLIEPIFISIATHNAQMGDWIINEFIRQKVLQHSALIGQLVLCDNTRLIDRIRIMLDKIIDTFATSSENSST